MLICVPAFAQTGLVGYWKLDEAAGTAARDSSGNANHCVMSPAPAWTSGKLDGALNFDGVDDALNCGSGGTLAALAQMTISAWVNLATVGEGGLGRILQKGTGGNPSAGWRLVTLGTKQLEFAVDYSGGDLDRVSSVNAFSFGTWTHVAVTWSGTAAATDVHLFVNGVEVGYPDGGDNGVGNRDSDGGAPLWIGNTSKGSATTNGKIDDVRVYDRVLSAAEIQALADSTPPTSPVGPAPVGYWKFDEGAGTTAQDSSGNGNHCTLSPAPAWATGKLSGALSFDGVDDTVSCGSGSTLGALSQISVAAWVNLASTGEGGLGRILQKGTGGNPAAGWRLVTSGTRQLEFAVDYSGGDIDRVSAINAVPLGTWANVAATWNGTSAGTGVRLYVNGVELSYRDAGDSGIGTRGNDTATLLRIGNTSTGASTAKGKIDDVRVYNRVLSSTEIQTLADATAPIPDEAPPDTVPPGAPSGLIANRPTDTTMTLAWSAATDNVGVTVYLVERCTGLTCNDFAQIASVTTLDYTAIGLTPSTGYSFRVRAKDAAQNTSAYSNVSSNTTTGGASVCD
ncbi:MAG: LamG-like jellyroll fold domain-containing protein [Gammaproteobacteria bacterium]